MANAEHVSIVRHIPLDELESKIRGGIDKDFPDMTSVERERIITRLKMIRLRYKGYSIADTADILGVNRQSCYNWQDAWNKDGINGLMPRFDGGAPSKLSKEQKADVAEHVFGREMCTDAVVDYVSVSYGVTYTNMQMGRILRAQGLVYHRRHRIGHTAEGFAGDSEGAPGWYWGLPETRRSQGSATHPPIAPIRTAAKECP